ncbi:MAG: DUF3592 domain-containing protein [Proteobacteria bacterium]|nr:DUF3592 domain-containing protein [Pseudomonadota bacterium]
MQLDVNGHVYPQAQEQTLREAMVQRPSSSDWSVTLEGANGDFLQAFARAGEHFCLSTREQGACADGLVPLRAEDALAALQDYLIGGSHWRDAIAWRQPPRAPGSTQSPDDPGGQDITDWAAAAREEWQAAREGREIPLAPGQMSPLTLAATLFVLALCGWGALQIWGGLHRHARALPWPWDSGAGLALGAAALVVTLLCAMGLWAQWLWARRLAQWQAVPGRIEAAQAASAADTGIDNLQYDLRAQLRYSFTWQGRQHSGSRIGAGPEGGGLRTTQTLQRYPVGSQVTVYVNPQDPRQTLLEPGLPEHWARDAVRLLLGLWLLAWTLAALVRGAGQWLQAHPAWLAQAREPRLAALAGGMGLLTLLIVLAGLRQRLRAAQWPVVAGVVTFSGVRSQAVQFSGSQTTMYQARVEYRYEVGGQAYTGWKLGLAPAAASDRGAAQAKAARYPEGKAVQVRYNPQEPGQAYVENSSALQWIAMLLAGLALCGVALYQAGLV